MIFVCPRGIVIIIKFAVQLIKLYIYNKRNITLYAFLLKAYHIYCEMTDSCAAWCSLARLDLVSGMHWWRGSTISEVALKRTQWKWWGPCSTHICWCSKTVFKCSPQSFFLSFFFNLFMHIVAINRASQLISSLTWMSFH